VQTGGLSSFSSGNESTTTPITNPNILWGAVAAAAVGASVAEWQKKREEEERRKVAEMLVAAERGTSKSAKAKYEAMMKHKRIVGESQGLLDKKYAEQKAQKKAQESTHNHLLNEHRGQQSVYVGASAKAQQSTHNHLLNEHRDVAVNGGGSKPLVKPVSQDDPPWWETAWNNTTTWVNDKVVQPVTKAYQQITQKVEDIATSKLILVQNTIQEVKKQVTQQWNTVKTYVNNNFIQPIQGFLQRTKTSIEIYKEHGWITSSSLMTQNQLDLINQAGDNMQSYVDGITNNNGDVWIDEYMSGVYLCLHQVAYPYHLVVLNEKF
jgi:hypothetical protein